MKKIEWMSDGGISYKIEIGDGSQTVTSLTPGVTPFVLNTDQDDDLFCPIRTQSGNIQIVEESVDIDDVIGDNPFARPVSLYSGTTLIWTGYLQGQAFTQTWDKGPNTISIPVTSPMNVLRCLYPSNDKDDLVYISFADFLCQLKVNNVNIYGRYIFPAGLFAADSFTDDASGKNPLRMKFNLLNYATWNEDTKQYDVQSYYDILEDIARLFGFQIVEKGMSLCFLWADQQTNYVAIVYEALHNLTSTPSQQTTSITQTTVTHDIWSNDHTMTFIPGKSKVTAIDTINELDDTIYSLDITAETFGQKQSHAILVADGQQEYRSRSFITDNNSVIYPRDSNVNFKFDDFKNETNIGYGCSIVRERIYTFFNRVGGGGTISDDTGWKDIILFRIKDLPAGTRMFTITAPKLLHYNGLTSRYYLSVKGNVRYTDTPSGTWQNFTGNLPISVKIGSASGGTTLIGVQDGKIIGGREYTYAGNQSDGYNIAMIQATGHITIEMLIPNDYTLGNYGINKNYYYCIENLEITYNPIWDYVDSGFTLNPYLKDYRKKYVTTIGFEDEYDMESSLFTWHTPVPLGRGLILGNNIQTAPTVLYGTNPPEEELAARLYAYYQQTRKKLEVVMRCTGDLYDPWMLHKPVTTNITLPGMSLLAQQIDFARDEIRCDLFDIS